MSERVICPECRREVGGHVPRNGDGSVLRPYPHKRPDGSDCGGRYMVTHEMAALREDEG